MPGDNGPPHRYEHVPPQHALGSSGTSAESRYLAVSGSYLAGDGFTRESAQNPPDTPERQMTYATRDSYACTRAPERGAGVWRT